MALLHTVLVSFWDDVTPDTTREYIYKKYQTLAEKCGGADAGILKCHVGWNKDLRKKVGREWHLSIVIWFRDDDALQAFRRHPEHTELTNLLRTCGDWVVADIDI